MTVRGAAAGGVAGGKQRARALVPGRPGLGPQLHRPPPACPAAGLGVSCLDVHTSKMGAIPASGFV